jgi:hypothetical protein
MVDWWPIGGVKSFPKKGSAEKAVCQKFVSNMLKLFVQEEVKVEKLHEGEEKQKNPYFVGVRNIPDPDAFTHATLGRRMPDIVLYDGVNKAGPSAIVLIGEVKPYLRTAFSDEDIGQLANGLRALLNAQPFRRSVLGVLTDGFNFYFLRCARDHLGNDHYEYSSTYCGTTGWQVIVFLSKKRQNCVSFY